LLSMFGVLIILAIRGTISPSFLTAPNVTIALLPVLLCLSRWGWAFKRK
jgi:hypothetical protein